MPLSSSGNFLRILLHGLDIDDQDVRWRGHLRFRDIDLWRQPGVRLRNGL
jgi:hypothetical protein